MTAALARPVIQLEIASANNVPQADSRDLRDRSLVVVVRDAKAAEQIADSISFTWRASVQRKRLLMNDCFPER